LHDVGLGTEVAGTVTSGNCAAAAVIAKWATDGSQGSEDRREGDAPGNYLFVPGTNFILVLHWRAALLPPAFTSISAAVH